MNNNNREKSIVLIFMSKIHKLINMEIGYSKDNFY
jgi:hypothetical protein